MNVKLIDMKRLSNYAVAGLVALLCLGPYETYAQTTPSAKRCEAITKKGTRCKNKAVANSRFCRVHQAQNPNVQKCKAITKSGTRCSRAATKAGYCTQHYKMRQEGRL